MQKSFTTMIRTIFTLVMHQKKLIHPVLLILPAMKCGLQMQPPHSIFSGSVMNFLLQAQLCGGLEAKTNGCGNIIAGASAKRHFKFKPLVLVYFSRFPVLLINFEF